MIPVAFRINISIVAAVIFTLAMIGIVKAFG